MRSVYIRKLISVKVLEGKNGKSEERKAAIITHWRRQASLLLASGSKLT